MIESPALTSDLNAVPESSGPSSRDRFVPQRRIADDAALDEAELRGLLQRRLRAASLVLAVGFGLFFIRALVLHSLESVSVALNAILLGQLLFSLLLLSSSWRPTLRELRLYEVGLFAAITFFFMAAQYMRLTRFVRDDNLTYVLAVSKSSVLCSFLMMLIYAVFIPNHWRRAAAVIVPMAVAPLVLPWLVVLIHPDSYEHISRASEAGQATEHALFLILGAFTAIYGAETINALRTEAHEARLLSQYRLGRKLGSGGMGEVYLAEHKLLKRPCAVKLIRPERADDPHTLARFEREVRAAAQLSHKNSILIFDYGRHEDGAFFYAMEFLPGLSLDQLVRRYGPMPAGRVIYLLLQACDALHEAHEAGLVHRDIKPANLFASHRGGEYDVAKILDFGLVKALQKLDGMELSREETVAGSPLYIAPEQIVHTQTPDRRADIYSIGAVAYFLLTGQPPFTGETAMEVMIAHTRDPVVPPSQIHPGIPHDLEQVILRCLAKSPDDRYPDAPSLAEVLAGCDDAGKWSARAASEWWHTHPEALHLDPEPDGVETEAAASMNVESPGTFATAQSAPQLASSEAPRYA